MVFFLKVFVESENVQAKEWFDFVKRGRELITPINVSSANLVWHEPEITCEIKVRNQFENSIRTGSKVGNLLKMSNPLLSLMLDNQLTNWLNEIINHGT